MIRSSAALLCVVGIALFGCAPHPESVRHASSGRECFHAGSVNDFDARGSDVVNVRSGAKRYYRLQLFSGCPNLDWTRRVALRTTSGSPWICQGMDAEIIAPEPGFGPPRCLVTSVRRLSDAEVAALRRR
jgi:hypothetical protein